MLDVQKFHTVLECQNFWNVRRSRVLELECQKLQRVRFFKIFHVLECYLCHTRCAKILQCQMFQNDTCANIVLEVSKLQIFQIVQNDRLLQHTRCPEILLRCSRVVSFNLLEVFNMLDVLECQKFQNIRSSRMLEVVSHQMCKNVTGLDVLEWYLCKHSQCQKFKNVSCSRILDVLECQRVFFFLNRCSRMFQHTRCAKNVTMLEILECWPFQKDKCS